MIPQGIDFDRAPGQVVRGLGHRAPVVLPVIENERQHAIGSDTGTACSHTATGTPLLDGSTTYKTIVNILNIPFICFGIDYRKVLHV